LIYFVYITFRLSNGKGFYIKKLLLAFVALSLIHYMLALFIIFLYSFN